MYTIGNQLDIHTLHQVRVQLAPGNHAEQFVLTLLNRDGGGQRARLDRGDLAQLVMYANALLLAEELGA